MKKTVSAILMFLIMAVFCSVAFANTEPTNSTPFTNAPVFGGNSQGMCQKTCTYKPKFGLEITNLNLNGQSKISFRPYYGSYKLRVYPVAVTTTIEPRVLYSYDHNTSLFSVGSTLQMKASIPSTNSSDCAYFSGHVLF